MEMKSCGQQCDLQSCFDVEQSHYSQKYQVDFVRLCSRTLKSFQPTYAAHSYDLTVQSVPDKVSMSSRSKQRQRTPSNKFSVDFLRCVNLEYVREKSVRDFKQIQAWKILLYADLHDFVLVLAKQKKLFFVLQWYFDLSKQKVLVLPKPKQNRAGQVIGIKSSRLKTRRLHRQRQSLITMQKMT